MKLASIFLLHSKIIRDLMTFLEPGPNFPPLNCIYQYCYTHFASSITYFESASAKRLAEEFIDPLDVKSQP
jgi:hypothetical protein